ncbi:MAG: shikimate dehydrogenase [Tissierellaceae bacterium]|nr:shikimate dehydrogenase [Tissierellaceae bacterium]
MNHNIAGKTKIYGVIGNPIAHSLSPVFQNYIMERKNVNGIYIPLKISPENLRSSIGLLRENFTGFNVTIPHKESIMEYLDEIDPVALEYKAVNTVKVVGGRLIGYNTDGVGFLKSLEKYNISLKGKRVLLLGAGGAAKVIAFEVVKHQGILTIGNRNMSRAEDIKSEITSHFNMPIDVIGLRDITPSYDIVINSTSVGMAPDTEKSIVDSYILEGANLVYDIVYNPRETKLLKYGRGHGIMAINGLSMLIYQGLKSFEIWTGERVNPEEADKTHQVLEKAIYGEGII